MWFIDIVKSFLPEFLWKNALPKCLSIVLFLSLILNLFVTPSSSSSSLLVRVGVLSLFSPTEVAVKFNKRTVVVITKHGKSHQTVGENFQILLVDGAMKVDNEYTDKFETSGAVSDFELSIPKRIKRRYLGRLEVFPDNKGAALTIVADIPIEEYVAGVVYSEMGDDAPSEAEKAMAVVARSFVLSSLNRHAKDGYDFCDTTHCAVYRGLDGGSRLARTRSETMKTSGIILTWQGETIKAFFHSTCGGRSHTPREVWGEDTVYPYRPVKCPYCAKAERFNWSAKIKKVDLLSVFLPEETGEITLAWEGNKIEVSRNNAHLLLAREEFRLAIGRKLGWNLIFSPWFDFTDMGDSYEFKGRGFGHGVGLCEEGAMQMARKGFSWRAILSFYFPSASF